MVLDVCVICVPYAVYIRYIKKKQYSYGENCAGLDFSQLDQKSPLIKRYAVAEVHQHEHGAESYREHLVSIRGDVPSFPQRRDVSANRFSTNNNGKRKRKKPLTRHATTSIAVGLTARSLVVLIRTRLPF